MNTGNIEVISFDCYGTLIDWGSGLLGCLKPVLEQRGFRLSDTEILDLYGIFEADLQRREYKTYRVILREIVQRFEAYLGFTPTPSEIDYLANSLPSWPPFADTVAALRDLKQCFRLVILSNTDDDLFAGTARLLETQFDLVITAQQVRSYKPSLNNFRALLDRIGVPKDRLLHAGQSLFHDIAPANQFGIRSAWVHRRSIGQPEFESMRPAGAKADIEVPDLRTLADELIGCVPAGNA